MLEARERKKGLQPSGKLGSHHHQHHHPGRKGRKEKVERTSSWPSPYQVLLSSFLSHHDSVLANHLEEVAIPKIVFVGAHPSEQESNEVDSNAFVQLAYYLHNPSIPDVPSMPTNQPPPISPRLPHSLSKAGSWKKDD